MAVNFQVNKFVFSIYEQKGNLSITKDYTNHIIMSRVEILEKRD